MRNYREGDVLLSRQEGFLFSRNGSVVDQQIAFNGESVFGIGKNLEVFATVEMHYGRDSYGCVDGEQGSLPTWP